MQNYSEIGECRICGAKDLEMVLDLGMQTIVAFPEEPNEPLEKAPLEVVMCKNCTLVQLKHSYNQDMLYKNYWYESAVSTSMVNALRDVVNKATSIVKLNHSDIVLDIASNDSTLLRQYEQKGITRIGIDPSNVARMQKDEQIKLINTFFSYDALKDAMYKSASIITCCGMFYDLDSPNAFLDDIKKILAPDGIFVIQMNYLALMLKNKTYDDICGEHREYYSFKVMEFLLGRHSLNIVDAELNDVNGGSIRAYVQHSDSARKIEGAEARLNRIRATEKEMGLSDPKTYREFASDILKNKEIILSFINTELANKKVFHIRGASTRGLTQVQFLNLTSSQISFIEDANPRKWGRFYADTKIKIISPDEAKGKKVDYKIVLPYHFISEIAEQEREFIKNGGKLIVSIPEFRMIGSSGSI